MSIWQPYVDKLKNEAFKSALIAGLDGEIYATSGDIQATTPEVKNLINSFNNSDGIKKNGFSLGGNDFKVIKEDGFFIHARNDNTFFMCAKTGKAVLVGIADGGGTSAEEFLVTAMEKVSDLVRGAGH